ncbi:MAG: 23S rRNA (adenine(2503)-C(2))-methyltransferase RlmN [Candidatus Omnitrophica bacterium]|nr:23S rRNA (adenine(2503)-C(2))-methyltransferase RlmN [Candidatus Omnitrophota bacterium]
MIKPSLYGLDLAETEGLMETLEAPRYRAKQILDWIYQRHMLAWEEANNLPKDLKDRFAGTHRASSLEFVEAQDSGAGESIKYLFRTWDGRMLESVLILQQDRRTVCVSTQLGCKIGCVFCASGKGKFGRNLTAGEIVEQVAQIEKKSGKITNVVFMGMGEPLDNFEATMKSLEILQAPWGFAMGSRRITVSTSGITPRILEFVKRNEGRVRLSVSLHAGGENKRTELVPINKKYPLRDLIKTLHQVHEVLKRSITFEYTLIDGVNDSEKDAQAVAGIAAPLDATVNVIPYNPIREMNFKTPTPENIERFRRVLENRKVRVTVRQTAGRDIHAACGQLRLDREEGI